MSDLHLAVTFSTAGVLRWAINEKMLTGEAIAVDEIPSIGPLDDGKERIAFLKALCFDDQREFLYEHKTDAFECWHSLQVRLRDVPVNRLVIWSGTDGSDYVFTRMACYWLEGIPVEVSLVKVPPYHGYHSISVYSFYELASFITDAEPLNLAERKTLAEEYMRIVAHPGLLRECDERGQLQFLDLSAHDAEIMSYCSRRWTSAVRVMGQTLGLHDPKNSLSELLVGGRMKALIEAGKLESKGTLKFLRTFHVRLPKTEI
ncbi:DUF3658 domain-containing protein [Chitinophaga sp. 22321]|uniref:DUF1835 domain-containing protein n=1 Tax=Chitinophaga hostae TaxID=2831022 RepID=A0ABS5IU93_9BACT|nr:DUF3658 domain-containing protein [Chitinophaga hostae]MBS0026534.1 DUF1835 domain-containing protein [Chitinophaga hostae]